MAILSSANRDYSVEPFEIEAKLKDGESRFLFKERLAFSQDGDQRHIDDMVRASTMFRERQVFRTELY